MKPILQVAAPPAKPLMIYDGDCNFCTLWIRRWQATTGDRIDYLPYQNSQIAARFPEIPRAAFEHAVQLIEPDGSVFNGAAAVIRALAANPHGRWLQEFYEHFPLFARFAEWAYGLVAGHRQTFSFLTRLLWGRHVEPPSHRLVRWTFLRCLGIVYLIAFVSLAVQIKGLVGHDGILPASMTMEISTRQMDATGIGFNRYHLIPTLCWFNTSDTFLRTQCWTGAAIALLLIAGVAPAPCLFLLWLVYLSLATIHGAFLGFQWDNLLLETGFLAIFFAPLHILPRSTAREAPPSRLVLWLLRWLVFRLMFESGCVKLLSGDPTWRHLTALHFHFETQPLPTWIGWYAHQLPLWIQKSDTVAMFAIELAVPFLIFGPRRPRLLAALGFAALQIFILLTGNYGFFNVLAIVLVLTLLDDAALLKCLPNRNRQRSPATMSRVPLRWPIQVTFPVTALVFCTSLVQFLGMTRAPVPGPTPILALYRWLMPFRSFNSYGLFAVMTTSRPEIIVQGSDDGIHWKDYAFKYKPGDVEARPRFVAPYQPRLDWQMWFAALSDYRENGWFVNFSARLLEGAPDVLALLGPNPFPRAPPRFVRALRYQYYFTDWSTRRQTGAWWRRELTGFYLPPISLQRDAEAPNAAGSE